MKLFVTFVGMLFLVTEFSFAFANEVQATSEKSVKKYNASSSAAGELHEMPVITNEEEYEKFQKQRELANRTSSSSSVKSNATSSHAGKSKAINK